MAGSEVKPRERGSLDAIFAGLRAEATQATALSAHIYAWPGLAWVKRYSPEDQQFYMVACSMRFIRDVIGAKHLGSYIGKTDFDFWPHDIASEFYRQDLQALEIGSVYVEEPYISPATGVEGIFRGMKSCAKDDSGTKYVSGWEYIYAPKSTSTL